MKYLLKAAVALSALTLIAGAAVAAPKAKTMKCPYCKMTMSTVKSKAMPVAVKLKTGTFYCCTSCKPVPKKKQ
jgi:uncharacterized protein with PIN domain